MWTPGSGDDGNQWMHWFQSRPGTQAADSGTVAFDYDMVFVFKSLMAWQSVQGGANAKLSAARRDIAVPQQGENGAPQPNYNGRTPRSGDSH